MAGDMPSTLSTRTPANLSGHPGWDLGAENLGRVPGDMPGTFPGRTPANLSGRLAGQVRANLSVHHGQAPCRVPRQATSVAQCLPGLALRVVAVPSMPPSMPTQILCRYPCSSQCGNLIWGMKSTSAGV